MPKAQYDHNGLTAKHGLFCHEFMKDYDASAAYVRAGYKAGAGKGKCASSLMQKPAIRAYIKKLHEKQLERADITAQRLTDELAKIAFSNIKNYVGADNEIQQISELDDATAAAIESVKVTRSVDKFKNETVNVSFKLHNKLHAIEQIAKNIGYFEKDNKQKPVLGSGPFKVEIVPPKED